MFLAEDSAVIRDALIGHIEDLLPAEVIAWEHSEQASVKWLRDHPAQWDVAILDLFLTQGSGLGIADSLNDRHTSQKVVVLSNYATPDIRARCAALGVDAVFDKSTELEEFTVFMLDMAKAP